VSAGTVELMGTIVPCEVATIGKDHLSDFEYSASNHARHGWPAATGVHLDSEITVEQASTSENPVVDRGSFRPAFHRVAEVV
jgi:hypothetical protein